MDLIKIHKLDFSKLNQFHRMSFSQLYNSEHPHPNLGKDFKETMPRNFINQPNAMPDYTENALEKAKLLRQDMTEAEKLLWSRIRAKQLLDKNDVPLKFRRQVPIGHYIIDFYCPTRKLAIELDGSQHMENQEYDAIRTDFLNAQGIKVLRFWNNDVMKNMEGVLAVILSEVLARHSKK